MIGFSSPSFVWKFLPLLRSLIAFSFNLRRLIDDLAILIPQVALVL